MSSTRRPILLGNTAALLAFVTWAAAPMAATEINSNKPMTDSLLSDIPPGVQLAIWVGRPDGGELFNHRADAVMPTASSIKTALLIELFAMHEGRLDQPPVGVADIFRDAAHPAFVHYSDEDRRVAREALVGVSVAELGKQMIRVGDAPNRVYNGAANVVIALLGGPKQATARIHERDARFAGHTVNRYMLADRGVTGDNTATTESLAAVHAALARREVAGLKPGTIDRLRGVLLLQDDGSGDRHYYKGGALGSDPITRVRAGWWESDGPAVVYAIMASAPVTGGQAVDGDTLNEYVVALEGKLRSSILRE